MEANVDSAEAGYGHGIFQNMLTSDANLIKGLKRIAEKANVSWKSPSSCNAYVLEPEIEESGSNHSELNLILSDHLSIPV